MKILYLYYLEKMHPQRHVNLFHPIPLFQGRVQPKLLLLLQQHVQEVQMTRVSHSLHPKGFSTTKLGAE